MVKAAVIGMGKMGISHCAILNAHSNVDLVGVCDKSKFLRWGLGKYSKLPLFDDYEKMIKEQKPDCVFIATPTSSHFAIAKYCLDNNVNIFLEKPCTLNYKDTAELRDLAKEKGLLIQVGYHNRYIGTFREVKRIVESGVLGKIYHFSAEAYGPVVVKDAAKTWRSNRSEGGGCLYDYASHVINLVTFVLDDIGQVSSTRLESVFSQGVDDAVYSSLTLKNGVTGHLAVSWSEESYRKMSTSISISGKKGRVEANAQEIKLYKNKSAYGEDDGGWKMSYITDYTEPVDYFLRGEEYSAQVDDFIKHLAANTLDSINSIDLACVTDRVVDALIADSGEE